MILGICGLGGSGKEILELVVEIQEIKEVYTEIVFIDKTVINSEFRGYKVYTFEEAVEYYSKEQIQFVISVGEPVLREKIFKQIKSAGYELATLIAPNVHIPKSAKLAEGVVIREGAVISVDVTIGDNVMVQPYAIIGHDCNIGCHSVLSANSVLAGGCVVGSKVYIALGCAVKELTTIGDDVIIAMGSIVNKNIEAGVVAKGNPAEIIGKNYLKKVFGYKR